MLFFCAFFCAMNCGFFLCFFLWYELWFFLCFFLWYDLCFFLCFFLCYELCFFLCFFLCSGAPEKHKKKHKKSTKKARKKHNFFGKNESQATWPRQPSDQRPSKCLTPFPFFQPPFQKKTLKSEPMPGAGM